MFDIYDDGGKLLREYFPTPDDLPDFIKEGGIPNPEVLQKLGSSSFAVEVPVEGGIKPAYPIINDAASAVSALYFEHTHGALPPQLQKKAAMNIKSACEEFGVALDPSMAVVRIASGDMDKEAQAPPTPMKKPLQDQGLPGTPWFPLSLPEQVKLASEMYHDILRKLSPKDRVTFSQNLLSKCAEFGVPTPATIERWAGSTVSKAALMDAIEKRAAYMSEEQVALLRSSAEKIASLPPEEATRLLETLDETYGIDTMYDRGVPDPAAIRGSVRSSYDKNTIKVAGLEVSPEQWEVACNSGVLDGLDPKLKSALQRDPSVLNQMPDPVQNYIKSGLESAGLTYEEPGTTFNDLIR